MIADVTGIAEELARRGERTPGVAEVARLAVDRLADVVDERRLRVFPLVRAFRTLRLSELAADLRERALGAGGALDHDVRCLVLLASRGEIDTWNDVERSVAHRVIPLSAAARSRAPMIAELAQRLDLHTGGPGPASTFHLEDARENPLVDRGFVRSYDVRSVFGFGATEPTGHSLTVVVFSRLPVDRATARSFELLGVAMKLALTRTVESEGALDARALQAARASALEEMCAVQRTHYVDALRRAEEAVNRAEIEERRRTGEREAAMRAENEKVRRAQRAVLNVIDDLREARATLELRVEERTQQIEELLERERRARFEAETARSQAESANRLKDEFLSTVSHELRTPLNAMLGWATLLRSQKLDPEKQSNAIDTIERNARAQVRLIDDLLDLGRILQGKFRLALGPVEVVPLIEAALESVRPSAEAKGIRLQRALDSHATVLGDGERIQQIAWNLLSNAVKFTPRGGRVHVTLRRAPSYVEVVVADDGQGISPQFLPHVFEPFRQADSAISRRTGGLGLGLSIVRSLVELHGGTVNAASDGVGKGTTFSVRIPIAPVRASSEAPAAKAAPGGDAPPTFECPSELARLRVLVVDDETDTRDLLGFILNECGATVMGAGSTEEAMALLDHATFDVIVSDIGLPGEDGLSFIRRVRQRPPERGGSVPAVALTAYARTEDRTQALRAGFHAHLAKPVDPTELTLVVAATARRG